MRPLWQRLVNDTGSWTQPSEAKYGWTRILSKLKQVVFFLYPRATRPADGSGSARLRRLQYTERVIPIIFPIGMTMVRTIATRQKTTTRTAILREQTTARAVTAALTSPLV